jgi:hypothetical protein
VLPIHEHFGAWGEFHRKLLGVPIGSPVRVVVE